MDGLASGPLDPALIPEAPIGLTIKDTPTLPGLHELAHCDNLTDAASMHSARGHGWRQRLDDRQFPPQSVSQVDDKQVRVRIYCTAADWQGMCDVVSQHTASNMRMQTYDSANAITNIISAATSDTLPAKSPCGELDAGAMCLQEEN